MGNNLVRKPQFYFALQVIGLAAAFLILGKFHPVRVGDTPDYEQFPFTTLAEAFTYPRTVGYPLFLQLTALFAPSHGAAAAINLVFHVVAVFVFWLGLKRVIRSEWTSMAVASSLLYSNILLRYGNCLAADSLASSLTIATIGWLMLTLFSETRRHFHWWGLALLVFAAYQVRPAYLFLVPLIPVLGLSLFWLVTPTAPTRRQWRSITVNLVLIVLLPYMAFCTARWLTVGHSSLVSFGGNNFAAITCMYITQDDVEALPADVRPLAEAVVRNRQEIAQKNPGYTAEATRSYMEIETPFDINIRQVCVRAARETCGDDWPQVDKTLWRFAFAVVAEKPSYYATWLVKAFIRGVYMIVSEYVMNPVYFLLIFAIGITHAGSVILRKRSGGETGDTDPTFFIEANALTLIAVSFAMANVLLVIITSPALGRFMDAAGVFFACVLVRALANRIVVCRQLIRRPLP